MGELKGSNLILTHGFYRNLADFISVKYVICKHFVEHIVGKTFHRTVCLHTPVHTLHWHEFHSYTHVFHSSSCIHTCCSMIECLHPFMHHFCVLLILSSWQEGCITWCMNHDALGFFLDARIFVELLACIICFLCRVSCAFYRTDCVLSCLHFTKQLIGVHALHFNEHLVCMLSGNCFTHFIEQILCISTCISSNTSYAPSLAG